MPSLPFRNKFNCALYSPEPISSVYHKTCLKSNHAINGVNFHNGGHSRSLNRSDYRISTNSSREPPSRRRERIRSLKCVCVCRAI